MGKKSWILYGLITALILVIDQMTKYLIVTRMAVGSQAQIIPHFFRVVSVRNTGIVFGLFSKTQETSGQFVFIVFTIIAMTGIIFYSHRKRITAGPDFYALALILGGAAGNLIDRILHGRVVDFLDFYIHGYHWPAFNIADSGIVIGVSLLLVHQWTEEKKQNRTSFGH